MNAATATSGAAIHENPASEEKSGSITPAGSDFDYFSHIYPQCPVICGLQLQPLSLTRYKLLKRFRVAFVSDEPTVANAGDLLIATLVCSKKWSELNQILAAPDFSAQLDAWAFKAGFVEPPCFSWPLVGKWLKNFCGSVVDLRNAGYLLQETDRFQQYITDNSKVPRHWDETTDDRATGSHWAHNLEVTLRSALGWTQEELDEKPLNQALWDYFKHMENQGLVRIMTPDEIEAADTPSTPEEKSAMQDWLEKLQQAAAGDSTLNPQPSTAG